MAESPRSMWSGAIRLGLLNIPVTLGKATRDERERGLKDLCAKHEVPVTRNERCSHDDECPLDRKVKGVENSTGSYRILSSDEYEQIEQATKLATLDILDAQPLTSLPLEFSTASWWIRPTGKGSEKSFAILVNALAQTGLGLVTKLANSSKQKLAVIVAIEGCLLLRQIPYRNELNLPGDAERAHFGVEVSDPEVDLAVQLLQQTKQENFDYASYTDRGMILRQEAIDRLLDGQEQERKHEKRDDAPADSLMETLMASIEKAKS